MEEELSKWRSTGSLDSTQEQSQSQGIIINI